MAEAEENQEVAGHWMDEIKGKQIRDPDNDDHTPMKIFNRMSDELVADYKENDNKVNKLPIWFAVEVKKSGRKVLCEFHSYGTSLEELKAIADYKKVIFAFLVIRCYDVDQQLRTKIVKYSFKGQGLGVSGRTLFTEADNFIVQTQIKAGVEENLFVDTEDWEFSGMKIDALCKQVAKNAGAHGAKTFFLGHEEKWKKE